MTHAALNWPSRLASDGRLLSLDSALFKALPREAGCLTGKLIVDVGWGFLYRID
jgi:hypothetical protein